MTAASNAPSDAVLAVLEHVDLESSALLAEFVTKTPHIDGCYAVVKGTGCSSPSPSPRDRGSRPPAITVREVNALACLLDAFAVSDRPRMRCVPLLEAAGWTLDRIASLPLVGVLLLLLLPGPPDPEGNSRVSERQRLTASTAAPAPPHPPPAAAAVTGDCAAQALGLGLGGGRGADRGDGFSAGDDDGGGGGDGGGGAHWPAESIGAELERLRPDCLPRWVTRKLEVQPVHGGGDGGGGGYGEPTSTVAQSPVAAAAASSSGAAQVCGSSGAQQQQPQDGGGGGPAGPSSVGGGSDPHSRSQAHQQQQQLPPLHQEETHQPSAAGCSSSAPSSAPSSPSSGRYVTLVDGSPAPPHLALRFGRVAVGGTFDRLHAGHELLLAATALVAEGFVFVGVTADALLANKSHKELLQPYDTRAREAVSYMQAVRPGLQVEAGPLCDPKAPTLAELDPDMEALVVSVETLPGAAAINAGRAARGFRPLTVITVPVIGLRAGAGGGGGAGGGAGPAGAVAAAAGPGDYASKLSSSGLRALEAAAAAVAEGGGGPPEMR